MQDLISEDNDISGRVFQAGVKGSLGKCNALAVIIYSWWTNTIKGENMDNNQPNYENKNEFGQNPYPQGVGQQVNYQQNSGQQMNYQQNNGQQMNYQQNSGQQMNYQQNSGQQANYQQNSTQQANYDQNNYWHNNWQADHGRNDHQQTAYEQAVNKNNNADKVNYSGGYVQPGTNDGSYGISIAGMILGIVSIVFSCTSCISFVLGVVGVVLSAVALSANSKGKEMAIAGVVCSIIGIFASIVWGILFILD